MIYTALLRGINIRGKNKIEMPRLRSLFEGLGMQSVVTYINSGNVIFIDDKRSAKETVPLIEKAIAGEFGLTIPTLVRSYEDMKTIITALPDEWQNDERMKSDVLFLWDEVDEPKVVTEYVKPEVDRFIYVPKAVLWSVDRKNVTRSGLMKLPAAKLYQRVTIRNVNTTRKIYQLMLEMTNLLVKPTKSSTKQSKNKKQKST